MHNENNLYKEGMNLIEAVNYILTNYEVGQKIVMVRSFKTNPLLNFYVFMKEGVCDEILSEVIDTNMVTHDFLASDWTVTIYKNCELPKIVTFFEAYKAYKKGYEIYMPQYPLTRRDSEFDFITMDEIENKWVIGDKKQEGKK